MAVAAPLAQAYRAAHRLLAFWRDHRETFDRVLTA
jgi:hypothetical protein